MTGSRVPLPPLRAVSATPRAALWVLCVWTCLTISAAAIAQSVQRSPNRPVSLAAFVPAEAGLFIEINGLTENPDSDRSRNARRLLDLLLGPTGPGDHDAPWRNMLLRGLGLDPDRGFGPLFARRLAIAAPSWSRLSEGAILVRLQPGDELLDKTFAPDHADSIDGKKDVIVYRTHTRLSAATNSDVLAISQRNHADSLYHGIVQRMLTGSGNMLADDPEFRAQTQDLPRRRDGTAYVRFEADQAAKPRGLRRWLPWPLTQLAVGVRVEADHVNFAFRAKRAHERKARVAARPSMKRMLRLPLTTLVAWSAELDVAGAFRNLVDREGTSIEPAYLRRFLDILDSDDFEDGIVRNLGPHAIITWDQYLGPGTEVPQIAIILESDDALACANLLAEAIQAVVTFSDITNRGRPGPRLRLSRTHYLGTAIHEIRLPFEAQGEPLWSVQPAFAAVGDTFVIAISADQIRNLIDAEMGLASTLNSLPEFARSRREERGTVVLGFARPALIAQTVDQWLGTPDGAMARWIAQSIGGPPGETASDAPMPKLGIGMRPGDRPGTVHVVRVDPKGRGAGRILPGDHILGVNGSLLSLASPTADLRQRVIAEAASGQWIFRIERDGQFADVTIPCPSFTRAADPTKALRQLQSILQRVDFGSLRAVQSEPDRVKANLTLRFAEPERRG